MHLFALRAVGNTQESVGTTTTITTTKGVTIA